MNDFRIICDIERIGRRRLLGRLVGLAIVYLAGLAILGALSRLIPSRNLIAAASSVFAGTVFGYVASFLTPQARRMLARVFALIPLVAVVGVLFAQVIIDAPNAPRFRLVIIPIFLCAGFVLGLRSGGCKE